MIALTILMNEFSVKDQNSSVERRNRGSISFSGHFLLCPGHFLLCPGHSLLCPGHFLLCPGYSLFFFSGDTIRNDQDTFFDVKRNRKSQSESNRDTIKINRDTIKINRDTFKSNRDTIKSNRDTIKSNRDTLEVTGKRYVFPNFSSPWTNVEL